MEETIKIQRTETEENRKQRYCDYERALKQLRNMKPDLKRREQKKEDLTTVERRKSNRNVKNQKKRKNWKDK